MFQKTSGGGGGGFGGGFGSGGGFGGGTGGGKYKYLKVKLWRLNKGDKKYVFKKLVIF